MKTLSNKESYKKLPCRSFIRDGYCPYHQRCQYIHDEDLRLDFRFPSKKNTIYYDKEIDLFYYPKKDCVNNRYYILNEKCKITRLPIMEHLSQGKSMETYIQCNYYEKNELNKKFKLNERDLRTSNMYNNFKAFIKEQRKMEKIDNDILFNKNKIRKEVRSPNSVMDIYL